MSLRFKKRIKIAPGVSLNVGKKSLSLSAGIKGLGLTSGTSGLHSNVGIPGSGISYRKKISSSNKLSTKSPSKQAGFEAKIRLNTESGEIFVLDHQDNILPQDISSTITKQNKSKIIKFIESECEKINSIHDQLALFHLRTPDPNSQFIFKKTDFCITRPNPPVYKSYGFLSNIFPWVWQRIKDENESLENDYNANIEEWKNLKKSFEDREAENEKLLSQLNNKNLFEKEKALEFIYSNFEFPRETNIDFDFSEDEKTLYIDVDLPEIEDIPNKKAKVNKKEIQLSLENISDTKFRKTYMSFIHSILFHITGVSFYFLPSLNQIVISGYSQRANPATGKIEDEYLLSSKISRDQWISIDFNNLKTVDPVKSFELFETRREMTKTGIFRGITPFGKV
ncbi:MAG TPA: DUF4236 domain-containing protein [Oligoflexia bacterium]|nr:DUF4236 domain-containing protein [Oligoflexia bacterium]HMP48884.1 DUF4236 domain-containing protein [Oligoflexia bacterium]